MVRAHGLYPCYPSSSLGGRTNMKELKEKILIESIEKSFDDFIDSDALYYDNCYPLDYDHDIREGLIRSYGHDMLIKRLCKNYDGYIDTILIIDNANKNKSIELTMKPEFFDSGVGKFESPYDSGPFETILNLYGFYLSKRTDNKIYLEPMYSDEMTDKVYKSEYLYHVTHKSRLDSILKTGLNPRQAKNRYYSHRIYLMYADEIEYDNVKDEAKKLAKYKRINRPMLLKIDISKCNNMRFYIDPNAGGRCIYTYDCIKPEWIVDYEQIGI